MSDRSDKLIEESGRAMETRLFEWAKEEGLTMGDLAERLGYSERHLIRIRDGEWPVTDSFAGRVVLRLGESARSLFFASMSDDSDTLSDMPSLSEEAAQ